VHQPILDHLLRCFATDHASIHFDPEVFVQTISWSASGGKIFKVAASLCHNQWFSGAVVCVLWHLGARGGTKKETHFLPS